jgi:hypothetical protein
MSSVPVMEIVDGPGALPVMEIVDGPGALWWRYYRPPRLHGDWEGHARSVGFPPGVSPTYVPLSVAALAAITW